MSLIKTDNGRVIFKKAESIMLVPYRYSSIVGGITLNTLENVYDISAVIGDSIEIEQSSGDTTTKNNEFKSEPLLEFYSGTKMGFTAQCLDLQNNVIWAVFQAMTVWENSAWNGNVAAAFHPEVSDYYVLVRIRFKDTSLPDVYLPYLQLNSRLLFGQLKTRASQGNIVGTALSRKVAIDRGTNNKLYIFQDPVSWSGIYSPYTPLLFSPRNKTPFFYAFKESSTQNRYSTVDFSTGSIQHNVLVNEATGDWTYTT